MGFIVYSRVDENNLAALIAQFTASLSPSKVTAETCRSLHSLFKIGVAGGRVCRWPGSKEKLCCN